MYNSTAYKPLRWMTPSRLLTAGLLIVMFACAAWVRLVDLAADPVDVAHSQQLSFLLTARSFQPGTASPAGLPTADRYAAAARDLPLLQWVDARLSSTFNLGLIEAARIVSVLGWLAVSALLYFLLRKLTQPLVSLAVLALMLFMPYAIQFSRVVLPGTWALLLTLLAVWMLWRWVETPRWALAIGGGLFGMLAALLDPEMLFLLAGAVIAVSILHLKRNQDHRWTQIFVIAVLLIAPRFAFALAVHSPAGLIANGLGIQKIGLDLAALKQVSRLELRAESIIGALGIGFALLGIMLTERGIKRGMLVGLWAGFGVFCLLSLNAIANSIYLLYPLILLAALSLVSIMEALLERMAEVELRVAGLVLLISVLIIGAGLGILDGRRLVRANPEQIPVQFWRALGQKLGANSVFLTNSDAVNLPLAYYGNVRPVCIETKGCVSSLNQILPDVKDYPVYFVTFEGFVKEDADISAAFGASPLTCDAGSGITVFPIAGSASFCNSSLNTGTQ